MGYRIAIHCWNKRGMLEVLEDDSEKEEMCELETPKIIKVSNTISEAMNWMERQND
jgi:hypothetical protein